MLDMKHNALASARKLASVETIILLMSLEVILVFCIYEGVYLIPALVALALLTFLVMCSIEKSIFLIPFFVVFSFSIPLLEAGNRTVNLGLDYCFLAVLICVWLMRKGLRGSESTRERIDFKKPLIVFTIFQGISAIRAFLSFGYIDAVLYLIIWTVYLLMFLVLVDTALPPRKIKHLLYLMLIIANAVAVYGMADYLLTGGIRIASVFGGIRGGPNVLGTYLAVFALLSLCFALYFKGLLRVMMILSILTLSTVLILTLSRSSWVALAGGVFVIGILERRSIIVWTLLATLFAILLLPKVVMHRAESILEVVSNPRVLGSFLDFSSHLGGTKVAAIESLLGRSGFSVDVIAGGLRYVTWTEAINVFRQFPLLGSGIFNILHFGRVGTTESLYLEIISGTGILGSMAFLWFGGKLAQYAFNAYRRVEDGFAHYLALGYLATLVALCLASVTGNVALSPKLLGVFWLLTGSLSKIHQSGQQEIRFSR